MINIIITYGYLYFTKQMQRVYAERRAPIFNNFR